MLPTFTRLGASIGPDALSAYAPQPPPLGDQAHPILVGQPSLFTEGKTRATTQEVICLRANGAYRLETFLFYSSLEHSNLNLKYNFSPHSNRQGKGEIESYNFESEFNSSLQRK